MEVDVCAIGICYSLAYYFASLFTFHIRTKYIFWFQTNVQWQRCFCDNTYFNHMKYTASLTVIGDILWNTCAIQWFRVLLFIQNITCCCLFWC